MSCSGASAGVALPQHRAGLRCSPLWARLQPACMARLTVHRQPWVLETRAPPSLLRLPACNRPTAMLRFHPLLSPCCRSYWKSDQTQQGQWYEATVVSVDDSLEPDPDRPEDVILPGVFYCLLA